MKPTIVNTLFGVHPAGRLAFGKPLLGYVFNAAFKLTEEGWRKLTLPLGPVLPRARRAQRSRLAPFLDRFLGHLQGLGHDADHHPLHARPDAADHEVFGRAAGRGQGALEGRRTTAIDGAASASNECRRPRSRHPGRRAGDPPATRLVAPKVLFVPLWTCADWMRIRVRHVGKIRRRSRTAASTRLRGCAQRLSRSPASGRSSGCSRRTGRPFL